jgi:hypothetical protein
MKKDSRFRAIGVPIIVALIGLAGVVIGALINKYTPPPEPDPPFYVYTDYGSPENHYNDITFEGSVLDGDDGSTYIDTGCRTDPKSGDTCIKLTYQPTDDTHWAGVMWLSGKQNFPPNPPVNGVDVSEVNVLKFWVRGTGSAKFFIENDTGAQVTKYVSLTNQWTEYTLALPKDWSRVCVGFGVVINYSDAGGSPMTVYVDEIGFKK